MPHLDWHDLSSGLAANQAGQTVRLTGWLARAELAGRRTLVAEQPCCLGCPTETAAPRVEVEAAVPLSSGMISLEGVLAQSNGRWRLNDARPVSVFGRRRLMQAAPLLCLAAASPELDPKAVLANTPTADLHSHAAKLLFIKTNAPFTPLAAPMREGGLAVTCLAIVSDGPTHRLMDDGRIHPFRDPAPGELYVHSQQGFARLHRLAQQQGLPIITTAAEMRAARGDRPSVVVSAEGADFLEGRLERVDEAYDRWTLRHLQLTHFRVNELGDIQTELPVHGGLTDFGADVIRRCNARGIVVDVAHGPVDLVRRAAAVTTKPLVLSHTSLTRRPLPFTRLITAEHAKLVAGTGGVIGIWPIASLFPDMTALAGAMARMAAVIGVDHVGLGTDMLGLTSPATFDSYAQLPELTAALLSAGFGVEDTRKLMGGNYARVFEASMTA